MSLIWCTRHGKDRGFRNQLVACVACNCRHRRTCRAYAETPLEDIVSAKLEASKKGHAVRIELPLFEHRVPI